MRRRADRAEGGNCRIIRAMPVALTIYAPGMGPSAERLRVRLRQLLKELHISRGAWAISLAGDEAMTDLHRRSMGLNRTTDVLTFDLREGGGKSRRAPANGPLDLETILCVDEARRRARERGHPLGHELLLYALHSLLHVQGYDDLTGREAARMHAREDELLRRIGLPAIYAAPVVGRARGLARARRGKATGPRRTGRAA
jgi:probable rRNA maturation factor